MKNVISRGLLLSCVLSVLFMFNFQGAVAQSGSSEADKMEWWKDGKFGMFLHWGLYSIAEGDWNGKPYKGNEHFMLYEEIPWVTYGETLAPQMTLEGFDADEWVRMAKDAGMKYVVVTAKHHDGFAMYDSPSSDYNIVKKTPYAKDPMKLLADACEKYDVELCFYYSLGRDWQLPVPTNWPSKNGRSNIWDFPFLEDIDDVEKKQLLDDYFRERVMPQVRELLTQYGPVSILWFDTAELTSRENSIELKKMINELQPNCIVNNRIGNGQGDYMVLEQQIGGNINLNPWESCVTMNGTWGFNKHDHAWKSTELVIRQLIETVSNGGNYLLNVGPESSGIFPVPAVERLAQIGEWMRTNSEAIYDTRPWKISSEKVADVVLNESEEEKDDSMPDVLNDNTSKVIFPEIRFTSKDDIVYVFANSVVDNKLAVEALGGKNYKNIDQVSLLGGGDVEWTQADDCLTIEMPNRDNVDINIVVFRVE